MEDVYTIKVKTKPDSRNSYPSERRYSASTVSGLAWVHVALAATTLLLACLTIVSPNADNITAKPPADSKYVLVAASCLVTVFGSAAGLAGAFAAVRWYESHHINRFFLASVLSAVAATTACICACCSLAILPNQNLVIARHADVVVKNESHFIISLDNVQSPTGFSERVMAINILIAAFLELLWSLLSGKIAYKGMRNDYKDKDRGNHVTVATRIKGNDGKIQNGKAMFLQNQICPQNTDTSEYRDRIMNFLNKCTTDASNTDLNTPKSVRRECSTPASWGDTPEHTVYNQNTVNFDKIFTFNDDNSRDNQVIDA